MRRSLQQVEAVASLPCKICGSESHLFDVVDFKKFCSQSDYYARGLSGIPIYYRKCESCSLIFTTCLDELDKEGFSELVYNEDYVQYDPDYVEARPTQNADFLNEFLAPVKSSVKGLDYGSGNGLTASLLAGKGWNYHACDPISNPVEPSEDFSGFNIISAIEVFEHIPFPMAGMEDLLRYAADDCLLIICTQASDNQVNKSRLDWWYAGPRNGHITLHSKTSLRLLFNRYGFSYSSPNSSLHLGIRGTPPDPTAVSGLRTGRPITWKKIKRWLARRLTAT
jgi:hypothetical protein